MDGLPQFGDTSGSPLMTDTLADRFTTGTNTLASVPVAPVLQFLGSPASGPAQIQLSGGETFRSYQMQFSDDFLNWTQLDTALSTNGSWLFANPSPPFAGRSYRAMALP